MSSPIVLQKATLDDAPLMHRLQIEAFQALLQKYRDDDTNPGAETLEKIVERVSDPNTEHYLICLGKEPIGVVRISGIGDTGHLRMICVLTEHQGRGIAQQAIRKVEALYPDKRHWKLDTILQEPKLRHLYEKMGYRRTGQVEPIKDGMDLVYYEKWL